MIRTLIVGAGGHAQVVADTILSRSRAGGEFTLVGFLDDNPNLLHREILGVRVRGQVRDLDKIDHDAVILAIGDNSTRARLFDQLKKKGERFVSVIHPRAVLAEDIQIGEGAMVFAGVVINTGAIVGPDVIINTGATVDHHARVGAHVHIAPGVHLGGTVTIGEGALIGIGSCVIPCRSIGSWAIVGAGAVVIKDVAAGITVVGSPARSLTK